MIQIRRASGDEWVVTVEAGAKTLHRVRVTQEDLSRFAEGRSAEELLEASFEFLLQREPNTSILGSFDLPVISGYFPEYVQEIRSRLRQKH